MENLFDATTIFVLMNAFLSVCVYFVGTSPNWFFVFFFIYRMYKHVRNNKCSREGATSISPNARLADKLT